MESGCGTFDVSCQCIGLDWDSSSGDDGTHQVSKPRGQCQSALWIPSSPAPSPPLDRSCTPTTPLSQCVCRQASSRLRRPTPTTVWQGSVQLTVQCDSALTRSSLAIERTTAIGSTLGTSDNISRRAGATHRRGQTFADSDSNFRTIISRAVMAASTIRISFTYLGRVTSVINRIPLAIVLALYFWCNFCRAKKPVASPVQYWLGMSHNSPA